ncbi:MAG: vWA domain-containing protein [Pseudomonadota bacterium]
MTTALMTFPIMGSVGAAIDYTRYYDMKADILNSADAANLAAAQMLTAALVDSDALEDYAGKFFRANLDSDITESMYTFKFEFLPGNTSVEPPVPEKTKITVDMEYETIFGEWLGVDFLLDTVISEISVGNRTVEIALVLDNSGSMSGNKIDTLKTEAKNLVDVIFNSAQLTTLPDPVQFSIVPFAGAVNVGTNNKNKNWMDNKGWSPVHHENLDWENTYRTNNDTRVKMVGGEPAGFQEKIAGTWEWKTRHDVFDMVDDEWAGCVEMRPWPHNVLDTHVMTNTSYADVRDAMDIDNDGTGDGTSALFVPYFAPDEPDSQFAEQPATYGHISPVSVNTDHDGDDDYYQNDYLYDFQDYDQNDPVAYPNDRDQLHTDFTNLGLPHGNPALGIRGSTKQIERTNWVFKYQRNAQYRGSFDDYHGPNFGCTTQAITELTDQRDDVKSKIDQMTARGSTNIQQGLTWGWRTISPAEPFVGGREYGHRLNMKFIVLLTDGNNFYQTDGDSTPNNTSYGAWGYARPDDHDLKNPVNGLPTHNRWIEGLDELDGTIYESTFFTDEPDSYAEFEAIMNAHTLQSCNNAKANGISIYAVAFDVPATGGVRELMEACAGSGIYEGKEVIPNSAFYYDVDGSELGAAFADIASQIANLRISR